MSLRLPSLFRPLVPLLIPLLLVACGDLPEPFLGNPGATARRLAVPETPMLAVPPPANALLDPHAGEDYAQLLALSLQKEEVPSLARVKRKTDWALAVTASRRGDQVVPRYGIVDPSGHELGAIDGAPWPAAGWTAGAPSTMGQAAQDAVPKVLALMMSIQTTRDRANPNSLMNRPARLFVPAVTGAPGDGNVSLTKLIRTRLAEFGPLVQTTPEGTDFTVQGTVAVSPLPKAQQQVEIAWTVTRPSGVVVGKVSQLNAIPAGSLDEFWGDVAVVVAQEASGGIDRVVERFIGRDAVAAGGSAAPAGASAGAAVGGAAGATVAGTRPDGTVGAGAATAGAATVGTAAVPNAATATTAASGGTVASRSGTGGTDAKAVPGATVATSGSGKATGAAKAPSEKPAVTKAATKAKTLGGKPKVPVKPAKPAAN